MKEEWIQIVHSTWLKIVMIAICIIPMIYAGVFLGSMWDPYGNASAIPVAVVNQDIDVQYNGVTLDVGKTLAQKLKDNTAMKFQLTNLEEAKKGLADGSYYMIVTIPKDFSKHATTLLDEQPMKMELSYTTNPGTNYIASKMDDSAMQKIKEQVRTSVTQTYADTLFSSVETLSTGLHDAADGSSTLSNGIQSANTGSISLNDNLTKLASSSLQFHEGTQSFTLGLQAYTQGVSDLRKGTSQLRQGIAALRFNTTSLPVGANRLAQGSSTLQTGLNDYTNAVATIQVGSSALSSHNTTLNNGLATLGDGAHSLANASQKMYGGLTIMSSTIQTQLEKADPALKQLKTANSNSAQVLQQLAIQADKLKEEISKLETKQAETNALLDQIQSDDTRSKEIIAQLKKENTIAYSPLLESLRTFSSSVTDFSTLFGSNTTMLDGLHDGLQKVETSLNASDETGIRVGMKAIQDGLTTMDENMNATNGLRQSVQQYSAGVDELSKGSTQLVQHTTPLLVGSEQLKQGTQQLVEKLPDLQQGIEQLQDGSTKLSDGATTLNSKKTSLLTGANKLEIGASQIQDGSSKLAIGSKSLHDGLSTLEKGSTSLHSALRIGADKSNVTTTSKTKDMLANPVTLVHNETSEVVNNGHAMAPYMMSVGLYVACMAFTLMYPLLKNATNTKSGIRLWINKASVMYTISTIMAIVMVSALILLNGLQPVNVGQTMGMAILISAAFMSFIVFLNLALGKIGSFVTLIFMVFQLGGAAGTYPIETSSSFFNTIHPYMPFSYSVDAFRHTLSLGGNMVSDCIVFTSMILLFASLTICFYHWFAHMSEERFEKTLLAKFQ